MGADYTRYSLIRWLPRVAIKGFIAYTRLLMKRTFFALLVTVLLGLPLIASAQTREKADADLQSVRKRIETLRKELEGQSRKRTSAERELAEVEKAEQQARRELDSIRTQLRKSQAKQAELQQQVDAQRAELQEQRAVLSQQLRIAYINGTEEWLRVALSQQDATAVGKRMTYYSYLSKQRSATIAKVNEAIVQIEQTQEEINAEMLRLADLESDAEEKVEEIAASRNERAALLKKISSSIESKDSEIDRLQAQADELTKLVKALARVVPQQLPANVKPFAGQAARLTWPVDGRMLKNFGAPRADGRLKWEGVLLGVPAGSAVKSVYSGRVVFAEWLAGLGLLAIIDHGGGYMTLYGHNQALLKDVGERVNTGDSIALSGDSGGQAVPALYFEIRKDGKPVNPANWIR